MKIKVMKWKEKPDVEYIADGLIRVNPNKPEYGSLMLMAVVITITNSFVNSRNRVAFITGELSEVESMINEYGLEEDSDFSELVGPHRIVVLEKLESELNGEQGYSEKVNPSTGEVLSKDGEIIYRKTELVSEGSDIVEMLITHDRNVEFSDDARSEFETKKKSVVLKNL